MSSLYEEWKPLRNHLGKMDVNDSLGVIRAYSIRTALREKPPFPKDIDPHPWIDKDNTFLPWDLESLAREAIICCPSTPMPSASMRNWKHLAHVMNKQKAIQSYIEATYIDQSNILHEVTVRLAHRQFKYQTERPSTEWLIRWSKIFMHPAVVPILKSKIGLEPNVLFTVGNGLFANYMSNLGMFYPPDTLDITGISEADYKIFMDYFAVPLEKMRQMLLDPSERHMDENFFHGYNSLTKYPLLLTTIDGRPAHICPIPTLLYWRITSGLYYDLLNERGFDNAFGSAFEDYVGDMFKATFKDTRVNIYPGEPNTEASPNRCDWVLDQPDEALITECKTKRLKLAAKISLLDTGELLAELDKLAEAIKQAYLSLQAYRDGAYSDPTYTLPRDKKAYIAVTTLEKWYLMGDPLRTLDRLVKEKAADAGLPGTLVEESPYIVASVDDIEELAYLAKTHRLTDLIQPYHEARLTSGWEFATYLNNTFKDELQAYEYVFDGELNKAFTVPIDSSKRPSSKKRDNPPSIY